MRSVNDTPVSELRQKWKAEQPGLDQILDRTLQLLREEGLDAAHRYYRAANATRRLP